MKQPKYFISSGFELKPNRSVIDKTDDVSKPSFVSKVSNIVIPKVTISPKILFSFGFLVLFSLTGMSIYSYARSHMNLPRLLPILHPATSNLLSQIGQGTATGMTFDIKTSDGRVDVITNFLDRYSSPLTPHSKYAQILVDTADKYNLDYRLLPAIMMQESNLCKAADPAIHNCLGFGINKSGTLSFDTYEESFEAAAKTLKTNYIDEGLTTPEQIMHKYTPSSNGSWANSVNQWVAEMEYNNKDQGIAQKTNADLTMYTK